MLSLLDSVESSSISIYGDYVVEKVMGDKYGNIKVDRSQGTAIGRGASAIVQSSSNVSNEALSVSLRELAETVRAQTTREDAEVEATLLDAAAKKVEDGDEAGAVGLLKKSAGWVLDLGKSAGATVLAAFLKAQLGI